MEFRLGSIPVKIHGSFAITVFLLSGGLGGNLDPKKIAIFAAMMIVAILLHELGHALTGRAFGLTPRIDLHGMGGTTSWPQGRKVSWWRSLVISAAGPITGIVFGVAALLVMLRFFPDDGDPASAPVAKIALGFFFSVSAIWGVFNLAPMLPLDGGNILLAFLQIVTKGRGEKIARYVSIVCGVGFVGYGVSQSNWWLAAICGLFLFRNIQALRQGDKVRAEVGLYERLKQGFAALEKKDGATAATHAEVVLEQTGARELRYEAIRLLAYARILEGQWGQLMALVERCREELGPTELERIEKAAEELDHPEEARRIRELRALAPTVLTDFRG